MNQKGSLRNRTYKVPINLEGALESEVKQLKINIPEELKAFLVEQSRLNASSQNSEIIRAIRERMARLDETQTA